MSLPALDLQDPRLAASLAERSLVISASAGSGKTFALVTLVLGFLGRGGRAPEIIATTFGREAAADLKSRILSPLDELATWDEATWREGLARLATGLPAWDAWLKHLEPAPRPEIGAAARQWLGTEPPPWMAAPSLAREHWIRTRREAELLQATTVHALALSVLRQQGGGVETLVEAQDPRLLRLLRQAGREVLARSGSDPDAPVARRFWSWCEGFEGEADRWRALATAFDAHLDALGTWRASLDTASLRERFRRTAGRLLCAYAPFARDPLSAATRTKQGKPHGTFLRWGLAKLQPEPEATPDLGELLAAVERMAQRFVGSDGRSLPSYYDEAFQAALAPLVEELPALVEDWTTLWLERVFRRFGDLKAQHGLLSYGDLVRQAWESLREAPALRPPSLLLVDEYQDVNPVQEAFLEALGARRTVRVGDPKQAIYGFRGGVPELLRRQLGEAALRGEAFRLLANHRSAAPIVELANAFVDRVMPALAPDAADPEGIQQHGGRGLGEGRTGLATFPSPKARSGDLPGATAWIAALARHSAWRAAGFAEAPEGRRALLLPRRTGLAALRRSLQARGIEALVQSREGFWESPGVRLLMALLEAVVHPEAPVPRLAVLRSPWVGATDGELLAFQRREPGGDRIREGLAWLAGLRALETARILAEGLSRPGLLELLASTLVHGRLEPTRALRNLDRFLGWAPTLPAIPALAWAELRQRRAHEDPGDAPAEEAAADLRVQTIHGAKGLEYDDVILPLLADRVKGVRKGTIRQRPGPGRELWIGWKLGRARGPALLELQGEEERRSFQEGLNLLYVGLTRARERLMLLQQSPEDAPPERATARRQERKSVCWHQVATDLAEACPSLVSLQAPPDVATVERSAAKDLTPPEPRPAAERPLPPPDGGSPDRVRKGLQLHALLREVLVREAIDPRAAEDHLERHPLLEAWPEAGTMVRAVCQELRARGWGSLPRRTEFPLEGAGKQGGPGRADLVIWAPDRQAPTTIILVDFKLAADFPDEVLQAYRQQLEAYGQALQARWPGAALEAWLVGLESGTWQPVSAPVP